MHCPYCGLSTTTSGKGTDMNWISKPGCRPGEKRRQSPRSIRTPTRARISSSAWSSRLKMRGLSSKFRGVHSFHKPLAMLASIHRSQFTPTNISSIVLRWKTTSRFSASKQRKIRRTWRLKWTITGTCTKEFWRNGKP